MSDKICGATFTATGEPCRVKAGFGTDHPGQGYCYNHDPEKRVKRETMLAFLAALRQVPIISRAAEVAGLSRRSHYKWLDTVPEYRDMFEDSLAEGRERVAAKAYDFIRDGAELTPALARLMIHIMKGVPGYEDRSRVETVDSSEILVLLREIGSRRGLERIEKGEEPMKVLADVLRDELKSRRSGASETVDGADDDDA